MRRLLGIHKFSGGARWERAARITLQRRFVSTSWDGGGGRSQKLPPPTGSVPGTYDLIYILLATEGDNQCNGVVECGLTDITSTSGTVTVPGPVVGIPEPGTLALFGTGLAGAVARRRRKKRAA